MQLLVTAAIFAACCTAVANALCHSNDPHCLVCDTSNPTKCGFFSSCKPMYGFNMGTGRCELCDPNCQLPADGGGCDWYPGGCNTQCKDGYGVDNNICVGCDPHCASGCTLKKAGKCDGACNTGYSLNADFTCTKCHDHCLGPCAVDHKCNIGKCKPGYTLSADGHDICVACDLNCAGNCETEGIGKCDGTPPYTGCKPEYYLTNEYRCIPCFTGCAVCSEFLVCDTCKDGYVSETITATPTNYVICLPCSNNCNPANGCDSEGYYYCDDSRPSIPPCDSGYGLYALPAPFAPKHQCRPCRQGCTRCNTAGGYGCDY